MYFTVFGGLDITEENTSYLPTAPMPRQLLALLLLNAGRIVPTTTCVTELWDGQPPPTAIATLQTYVKHLRICLARIPTVGSRAHARCLLEMRGHGYRLHVARDRLDLNRFHHLLQAAKDARNVGQVRDADRITGQALALRTGPVLAGVRTGPVLTAAVIHLEQTCLTVLEARLDARLRSGHHRELLAPLATLVQEHPVHEHLHGRYMIALYRSGRPGDALQVAARLRSALEGDLGIAPSASIQELEHAVRSCDPGLEPPAWPPLRLARDLVAPYP
jgi:SARP family transcriptional regulator, regulator of embCAB operon